ncbi:hypothetical protein H5410_027630 [Solanum commersonii]|uniref:Uncharacterized protein n=1 Tax=Solanum commersonii TaxID=4109 RepID=A0A9J5Z0F1_SOLCO|nr:hypothetical protein H5410_027630 [Solanum commersonii]
MDTSPSNGEQQRPGKNVKFTNEFEYDHRQGQQAISTSSHSKKPREQGTQAGKSTNFNPSQNVVSSSSDGLVQDNTKGQKAVNSTEQEQGRRDNKSQQ